MSVADVMSMIIPVLLGLLLLAVVWTAIELALTVRRARKTLSGVDKTLSEVDEAVAKVDPLIEHATLTIDALNLEIMRIDGILEDVEQVTDAATSVGNAVSSVTNVPLQLAASLVDRFRLGSKNRSRVRSVQHAVQKSRVASLDPIQEDGGDVLPSAEPLQAEAEKIAAEQAGIDKTEVEQAVADRAEVEKPEREQPEAVKVEVETRSAKSKESLGFTVVEPPVAYANLVADGTKTNKEETPTD